MLFSNFHQRENMFQTKVIMKITEEAPEIKVPDEPLTRAEAKEQNKRRYLPAERLQIQLNKQMKREKKKNRLKVDDVDKITESMGRVIGSLGLV